MSKVAIILADGFEEIEAVSVIDILRRGEVDVVSVGINKRVVKGAHGIEMKADMVIDDVDVAKFHMLVLPGGLPGSKTLASDTKVQNLIKEFNSHSKKIAAICAAPWALSTAKVLKQRYTCYPGFEERVDRAGYCDEKDVVIDDNIITSKGPATAMKFAITLVNELKGADVANAVSSGLLFEYK